MNQNRILYLGASNTINLYISDIKTIIKPIFLWMNRALPNFRGYTVKMIRLRKIKDFFTMKLTQKTEKKKKLS